MSDRCYMEIACRKEDQERFASLGFVAQDWKQETPALVVMVDEEADYAHCGNLPTDVPYHGHHGAGGNYGHGALACDGETYAEVQTGHGSGFVVDWDEARQRPTPYSLHSIREYLQVRQQVREMFEALTIPT